MTRYQQSQSFNNPIKENGGQKICDKKSLELRHGYLKMKNLSPIFDRQNNFINMVNAIIS